MSDETHVTRYELQAELRSFRNEVRVLLALGIVLIRFDIPTELTAAALGAVALKMFWGFLTRL